MAADLLFHLINHFVFLSQKIPSMITIIIKPSERRLITKFASYLTKRRTSVHGMSKHAPSVRAATRHVTSEGSKVGLAFITWYIYMFIFCHHLHYCLASRWVGYHRLARHNASRRPIPTSAFRTRLAARSFPSGSQDRQESLRFETELFI